MSNIPSYCKHYGFYEKLKSKIFYQEAFNLIPYALLKNVLLYSKGILLTRSRTFLNAPQGILYKICGHIL